MVLVQTHDQRTSDSLSLRTVQCGQLPVARRVPQEVPEVNFAYHDARSSLLHIDIR